MEAAAVEFGDGSFKDGFKSFLQSGLFADVTVHTASGEWHLHSLLLAAKSEFFARALSGEFTESKSKVIELHLEKSEEVWPSLVDYFYTDSIAVSEGNVLALLALSRQLLVRSVDRCCLEFVSSNLDTRNCISYLRRAVKYAIHDIQQQCITLAAQGFHFLYDSDVSGLPPSTVLDILRHPDLLVHCEQQVLRFVLRYLATTQLDPAEAADICAEVRFLYIDNQALSGLAAHPQLPRALLLQGAMSRLACMDRLHLAAVSELQPAPRPTYCCDARYGLPGGCRTLTVQLEDIWQHVAPLCSVVVSGVSEGEAANVLSGDPDAFFETDESSDPLPWVQVVLPSNMRMVQLSRYTFSHGHRRSGYYRMRNWQTLTAPDAAGPFRKIAARSSVNEPFEVNITKADQEQPFRAFKLAGTDRQEDAVYRLAVRNLKLFGQVEVDLLAQGSRQALVLTTQLVDSIKQLSAAKAASAAAPREAGAIFLRTGGEEGVAGSGTGGQARPQPQFMNAAVAVGGGMLA